jgi:hypothetical protein
MVRLYVDKPAVVCLDAAHCVFSGCLATVHCGSAGYLAVANWIG